MIQKKRSLNYIVKDLERGRNHKCNRDYKDNKINNNEKLNINNFHTQKKITKSRKSRLEIDTCTPAFIAALSKVVKR